eukprot:TRINITY_DN3391_c0_g1_i1.p1 TRINITY_DN3391_c0_g1~~TRINITY_DN3391_c0_g1_i1.p1  ORF type:complete len:263 (+),score=36.48 TRINITY_DN3391_c0_g1_i1:100-888(+)
MDDTQTKEICRDFKRGPCPRGADCPYLHRKRKDLSVEICRDYSIRGNCPRKGTCPYRHPKNVLKNIDIYSASTHSFGAGNTAPALFCHDYLVGKCLKGSKCPHLHSRDRVEVCRNYLRGSCTKDDCELHHPYTVDKIGEICRDYQTEVGCLRGEKCPFVHVPGSVEVCRDYMKGECTRHQCAFHHPIPLSPSSSDSNKRKRNYDGEKERDRERESSRSYNGDSSDIHRLRDEIRQLREENKSLRQENNSLRNENSSLKRGSI